MKFKRVLENHKLKEVTREQFVNEMYEFINSWAFEIFVEPNENQEIASLGQDAMFMLLEIENNIFPEKEFIF